MNGLDCHKYSAVVDLPLRNNAPLANQIPVNAPVNTAPKFSSVNVVVAKS